MTTNDHEWPRMTTSDHEWKKFKKLIINLNKNNNKKKNITENLIGNIKGKRTVALIH